VADVRVVVVEVAELERIIVEAVRAATVQPSSGDDWVDARTSGLGRRTFRRLVREGAFPASKRGKAYVARRADVDAYLERQRIAPTRAPSATEPSPPPNGAPLDPIAAALAEGRLRIVRKPP
jgi:excisionase family DNA binding protein